MVVLLAGVPSARSAEQSAAPLPKVLFAGQMYVTDASDIKVAFPYLSNVIPELAVNGKPLSQVLAAKYHGFRTGTFEVDAQQLGDSVAKAPLVMGLAFDSETVSVERFSDVYKTLIELSAQVLVFDYKNRTVISAVPLFVQRVEVSASAPTDGEMQHLVLRALMDNAGHSIVDEFDRALPTLTIRSTSNSRLGIRSVVFRPAALERMSKSRASSPSLAERALANRLAQYLAVHQKVAVVPYSKGQSVGGAMALRYADGNTFTLRLPEPDYAFEVEVLDLRKATLKKTVGATAQAFGVFAHVRLLEPLSGRTYLDVILKHAGVKTVPVTQQSVDDGAAYQEVLLGLIDGFAARLSAPSLKDWLTERLTPNQVLPDLTVVSALMEKCR